MKACLIMTLSIHVYVLEISSFHKGNMGVFGHTSIYEKTEVHLYRKPPYFLNLTFNI